MKEVFKKMLGLEPMSAEDREAFAVGVPIAVCVVLAISFLALV
jgi:hypothetical protein